MIDPFYHISKNLNPDTANILCHLFPMFIDFHYFQIDFNFFIINNKAFLNSTNLFALKLRNYPNQFV
jgi:hypothetical protein